VHFRISRALRAAAAPRA